MIRAGGRDGNALSLLARLGLTHGGLSPYNLLAHEGRLLLIELPQVVDVIDNPRGPDLLARGRGGGRRLVRRPWPARGGPEAVTADLLADAGYR